MVGGRRGPRAPKKEADRLQSHRKQVVCVTTLAAAQQNTLLKKQLLPADVKQHIGHDEVAMTDDYTEFDSSRRLPFEQAS